MREEGGRPSRRPTAPAGSRYTCRRVALILCRSFSIGIREWLRGQLPAASCERLTRLISPTAAGPRRSRRPKAH